MKYLHLAKRKLRSALKRARRFFVSQRFGLSPNTVYGKEFFQGAGFSKTRDSADKIARFLQSVYSPRDVLDIGCGPGEYLRAFSELGVSSVGCDGSVNGVRRVVQPALAFVHDLRKPLELNKDFDLVICVEVAEHIPRSCSAQLVASICRNAKEHIAFSAAPPGTPPGDDHINCQPIAFWAALFHKRGFEIDLPMTKKVREFAVSNDVALWWQQWSYIFRKIKS